MVTCGFKRPNSDLINCFKWSYSVVANGLLREQFLWTEAGDKLTFHREGNGEDGYSEEADISQDYGFSDDGGETNVQNNGKVVF